MAELITPFEVAEHIHSSVWQKNGVFSNEMLHSSNFHRRLGHVTATEQVMVFGRGDPTLPGSDVLSWSEKKLVTTPFNQPMGQSTPVTSNWASCL